MNIATNSNILEYKHLTSIVDSYDVFLFDLWGVVIESEELYPDVIDAINNIPSNKQVLFVSNVPRTKAHMRDRLLSWGITAREGNIFTSGEIALELIINANKYFNVQTPKVYHLGLDRNNILEQTNCIITDNINDANILLITVYRDDNEDIDQFDHILKAAAARNIINICANPDIMIPNRTLSRYCAGFFAKKLEDFGGKVIYAGKPHQEIYNNIINNLITVPKSRILMIGDTFETDIAGAQLAGIHSALVLTGNAKQFHKQCSNMNAKLEALTNVAQSKSLMPNFVIQISHS